MVAYVVQVRWDPDEEAPKAAPVVTTVNAWEIDELEDDSEEEEHKGAVQGRTVVKDEHLTSGTMSHVSADEDTPRRKRKAGWDPEPLSRGGSGAADRSSAASDYQ